MTLQGLQIRISQNELYKSWLFSSTTGKHTPYMCSKHLSHHYTAKFATCLVKCQPPSAGLFNKIATGQSKLFQEGFLDLWYTRHVMCCCKLTPLKFLEIWQHDTDTYHIHSRMNFPQPPRSFNKEKKLTCTFGNTHKQKYVLQKKSIIQDISVHKPILITGDGGEQM